MKQGIPIGSMMPHKRGELIEAKDQSRGDITDSVVSSKAQDRILELIEREQLPGDVRDTLAGALTGDLRRQQLLFQAMIDTWPRLQKNLNEVIRSVKKAPWEFDAFAKRGETPTDKAIEKVEMVEDKFWGFSPRAAYGERSAGGLIEDLALGYFMGHQVIEVRWNRDETGVSPRASKVVPPRFYGYPYEAEGEDRLMYDPTGGQAGYVYDDFPEYHFLIAINGGHPGHAAVAAPLRALTGYWLAATFGLKWLLQFSQLYGVPFRWATYSDDSAKTKVCNMLENIGSAGWGAFPEGTKLDFVDASKSASALPQKDLIEMADLQCDTFILGQTLTTSVGASGSRALGDVHADVKTEMIEGIIDFVSDIINEQLVPSMLVLNYGNKDEMPTIKANLDRPKDEKGMAERDRLLFKDMGMPVERTWLYERHGVPIPDDDEADIFMPASNGGQGEPDTGKIVVPHETKSGMEKEDEIEDVKKDEKADKLDAADQSGKRSTIEQLTANALEELTGVTKEWLAPVRPTFERLAALSMSKHVSDDDFLQALQKAQKEMPELFDRLNVKALEDSFKKSIGTAMISGSVSRYE